VKDKKIFWFEYSFRLVDVKGFRFYG